MPKKIVIELTETEIKYVRLFRKKKVWQVLKRLKPGSIELHFDNQNEYKKKDIHIYER